jgi:hypothetical protein
MNEKNNINSILNAVNEINLRPKKKTSSILAQQNSLPKLNQDLIIPLDVDKIILEAEEYKKSKLQKDLQVDLIKNRNDTIKIENRIKIFEETKTEIIDVLYTKFTKKVKKNTLKVIFDLHLKIKDLEKKLENLQVNKGQHQESKKIIFSDKIKEPSKILDQTTHDLNKTLSKNKNFLKDEVVTFLKIQDSTITILKEKIINYKKTEDKLRLQITDIIQNKSLLLKKVENLEVQINNKNTTGDTKETLKSIYQKIKKQKNIFLDLKKHSINIERDYNFYKKIYENLLIESHALKKQLSIAKLK